MKGTLENELTCTVVNILLRSSGIICSKRCNWAWDSDGKAKLVLSFLCPADGKMNKIKWILTWPLIFVLFCTIPNCSKPRWERCFMVTFVLSTLWIALFSYFMVWMVSACSRTSILSEMCLST